MALQQGLMLGDSDDISTSFDVAAAHEFDFVELNMETGFARDRIEPTAVAAAADDRNLGIVVHLPYRVDPNSPHAYARDGARQELEAALDVASELGAHRAVMHANTFAYGDTWDQRQIRDLIVETADRLARYGSQHGIDVAVENLKGEYYDVQTYAEIADRTAASLCLDTGHAYVTGVDASAQGDFLRQHGAAVTHIHLNDSRRADDDEHLPVGLGSIDFEQIAAALTERKWSGTATHEVWAPTGPGRVATAGKRVFDAMLGGTFQNENTL